jgi:hypothetical protein
LSSAAEGDGDCFIRRSVAPDMNRLIALDDHVFREDVRKGYVGPGAGRECEQN